MDCSRLRRSARAIADTQDLAKAGNQLQSIPFTRSERGKAKHGWCEGTKPYGYFEEEAQTSERIRQLRAEGLVFDRIPERLSADGFKGRSGDKWHRLVVNRILTRTSG